MAGLDPAIHVDIGAVEKWMAGSGPAMTMKVLGNRLRHPRGAPVLAIPGFGLYSRRLRGETRAVAPFVYRLGLKIFNLARGVRLS